MKEQSFLSRVRNILPDLHPAEKKLGELVCDFPGEIASYSASELANLAEVSNATVTRFVRRLGYATYEEARRHARLEKDSGSRLYLNSVNGTAAHLPQVYMQSDIKNVERTIDSISAIHIEELSKALLAAQKVSLIGFRVGAPLAQYLQWQLLQVIENIVMLPSSGQTMGENLAALNKNDVVVLFGLRRRVSQFDSLVKVIANSPAKLLIISDESMPIELAADWHFRCSTHSSGPLFSHVGVMALLNLITNRTIDEAGETGRKRLQSIENLNEFLGEL
ncbi:MurR/RpiR family transcriptional regulator [Marinomonas epiphytica]